MDEEYSISLYPLSWRVVTSLIAAANFITFFGCLFFLISMLTSKKRILRSTYNVYLFFLILPDTMMTLIQGLLNLLIAIRGGRSFPPHFYSIFIFVFTFYYCSNNYVNAILAYEINVLVHRSYRRIKTPPPKLRRVLIQVICAYVFAGLIALWSIVKVPWALHHISDSQKGIFLFGSPPDNNEEDSQILKRETSLTITFILFAIPVIYVIIIRTLIWKKNLLPKSGRTRVLSLFFLRIIIIFLLFYLPSFAGASFVNNKSVTLKFWGQRISSFLAALQAIVTLIMVSYKDDVRQVLSDNLQKSIIGPFRKSFISLTLFGEHSNLPSRGDNNEIERSGQKQSQWDEEDEYEGDCVKEMEEKTLSDLSEERTKYFKYIENKKDIENNEEN